MHRSLQSVLSNFEIMHIALPEILHSDVYDAKTKKRAENILTSISNREFIAKLILADNVFMHFEAMHMEKVAQNSCFGPFEYVNAISALKTALQTKLQDLRISYRLALYMDYI